MLASNDDLMMGYTLLHCIVSIVARATSSISMDVISDPFVLRVVAGSFIIVLSCMLKVTIVKLESYLVKKIYLPQMGPMGRHPYPFPTL